MSSDPTQPLPERWKQPQDPQGDQGYHAAQGYQGFPAPRSRAGQDYQDSQQTQRLPVNQPYRQEQGYPQDQGYRGTRGSPDRAYPAALDYQAPPARIRRRRRKWPLITVIVIIFLLLVADRGAKAYAEDRMASQLQSSLDLSGKPDVSIQGFPFLTQLAARDFRTVNISASNETAGPGGQLEVASLAGTLHGMRINGTNSATIDQFNASALITFTALANAGGLPQGITLSAAGPNEVKASIDILGFRNSAIARVTKSGPSQINVHVINADGIPGNVLGNLANYNVNIPKLPAGVTIQSVDVTQQGVLITAAGHDTTVSQ